VRILGSAGFDVAAVAASVGEAARGLLPHNQSILLILHVSDDRDGMVGQIRLFREHHPAARVVLLHDYDQLNKVEMIAAFQAGVDAYFVKPSHGTFIKSLELVMLGETILSPAVLSSMLEYSDKVVASDGNKPPDEFASKAEGKYTLRLSERQKSVLRCLVEGDSNKVISLKINIAEATVKVHVKAILRKIGVSNRTQAATWAMTNETLIGSARAGEPARSAIVAEPSLGASPSEQAIRAAETMNADLTRRASARAKHDRQRERRLAEDADRQRANASKTAQLSQLRQTREAAGRGGAAPGAASKSVAPPPVDKPKAGKDE
jgi:two-component system nitrate/nitrite response regulator NarL